MRSCKEQKICYANARLPTQVTISNTVNDSSFATRFARRSSQMRTVSLLASFKKKLLYNGIDLVRERLRRVQKSSQRAKYKEEIKKVRSGKERRRAKKILLR